MFLTYKDFDVNKRIIFTTYCKIGNQTVMATGNIAIITENEVAFKQIKQIQELYDLCEEKYEYSKTQKTKLQNKSTLKDFRPKLLPICKKSKNFHHTSYNCSKKLTKKLQLSENFSTFSHKRGLICKPFSHLTNNSSFSSITNSLCSFS